MVKAGLLLMLGTFAVAQDSTPSGTHPSPKEPGAVRPNRKSVGINADTVRAAQEKLAAGGYYSGTATGAMDAGTRSAIRKYQAAEGLTVNGRLDESTLSHLNIAAGSTMGAAPADMGRGAKAAGHNVKGGHPVEAGKAIGEGTGRSAKKVGEGTKSGAVQGGETAKDVGSGAKEGGESVGHGAKEGAKSVGHGAKEGAKKVGHGVKKGVSKVGDAVKGDDKKPDTQTPPPQI
jgi:peptidoglycan hydrolase-like protein with peptidoglycan-binding domain